MIQVTMNLMHKLRFELKYRLEYMTNILARGLNTPNLEHRVPISSFNIYTV